MTATSWDEAGDGGTTAPARIPLAEVVVVGSIASAIAAAFFWPVLANISGVIPGGLFDPLILAWSVSWDGHALIAQPLDYFSANTFWPLRNSLAFGDVALVGYGPVGLIGSGPRATLVHYNVLFLFAFALPFLGAHLLARELGICRIPALAAGAAFAWAPFRLAHVDHLNILSSGGIALSLFLLIRGYRRNDPKLILAGWLAGSWQMTLGFNLGLQLAYLLAVLGVVQALQRWKTELPARSVITATVGGLLVFGVSTAVMAHPYVQVAHDHPEAKRSPREVATFSPLPQSFLAAPEGSLTYGRLTRHFRDALRAPVEQTLFPGIVVPVLALIGLVSGVFSRRRRLGLAAGIAVAFALSLGFHVSMGKLTYLFPYRVLYELAPGWQAIRTPGRLMTLVTLGLSLLGAAGVQALGRSISRSGVQRVAGVSLVALVVLEGIPSVPFPQVPQPAAGWAAAPTPQLHLPTDGSRFDILYTYWSTDGFPALVNGASGFEPRGREQLRSTLERFPDPESIRAIRSLGVRVVVLHRELARGTPWEATSRRPITRLPITIEHLPSIDVYRLK